MDLIYVLAFFDSANNFVDYVLKGKTHSVAVYNSLDSAERGAGHTKATTSMEIGEGFDVKILVFDISEGIKIN